MKTYWGSRGRVPLTLHPAHDHRYVLMSLDHSHTMHNLYFSELMQTKFFENFRAFCTYIPGLSFWQYSIVNHNSIFLIKNKRYCQVSAIQVVFTHEIQNCKVLFFVKGFLLLSHLKCIAGYLIMY
jgi:hypothetical protein